MAQLKGYIDNIEVLREVLKFVDDYDIILKHYVLTDNVFQFLLATTACKRCEDFN